MKQFGFLLTLVTHGTFVWFIFFLLPEVGDAAFSEPTDWDDWVFLIFAFLWSWVFLTALALEWKFLWQSSNIGTSSEGDSELANLPRNYLGVSRLTVTLVLSMLVADVAALVIIVIGVWTVLNVIVWPVVFCLVGLRLGALQNSDDRFIISTGVNRFVLDLNRSY